MTRTVWICRDAACDGARKTMGWCPVCGKRTDEYAATPIAVAVKEQASYRIGRV